MQEGRGERESFERTPRRCRFPTNIPTNDRRRRRRDTWVYRPNKLPRYAVKQMLRDLDQESKEKRNERPLRPSRRKIESSRYILIYIAGITFSRWDSQDGVGCSRWNIFVSSGINRSRDRKVFV